MKKLLPVLCCLFMLVTLVGCHGEDNEYNAMQTVNDYLTKLSKLDLKGAAEITGEVYDEDNFAASGYTADDLKKLMFSNLKYAIRGESYDSSKHRAAVKVNITNSDYQSILQAAQAAVIADPNNIGLDSATLNGLVMKEAKKLLKDADKRTQTVTVLLEKGEDGTFRIIEDNAAFHYAITGQDQPDDE